MVTKSMPEAQANPNARSSGRSTQTVRVSPLVPAAQESEIAHSTISQHASDWLCCLAAVHRRPVGRVMLRWSDAGEWTASWTTYDSPARSVSAKSGRWITVVVELLSGANQAPGLHADSEGTSRARHTRTAAPGTLYDRAAMSDEVASTRRRMRVAPGLLNTGCHNATHLEQRGRTATAVPG